MKKMKKIKLIFTSVLLVFMAMSCENDGGTSVLTLTEGVVPNIKKIATTDQGLNLLALKNGQNIDLGLTFDDVKGFGEFTSLDVIGFYTKNGVTERAVLKANITAFPATVHLNQNDLYAAFTAINSANDVGLLDKLIITAEVKQKDGTVRKMFSDKGDRLFGADIDNSLLFSVYQTYAVSCPLDDASLFNGNYKVTMDTWQDYSIGDIVPVVYNSADGKFTFRILNKNNPFVANAATSYMICVIDPATAKVTVTANEVFDYGPGYGPTTGTGTIGSCTGDINLTIAFGPYGGYKFNLVKA